jgi:hypothetical protein
MLRQIVERCGNLENGEILGMGVYQDETKESRTPHEEPSVRSAATDLAAWMLIENYTALSIHP